MLGVGQAVGKAGAKSVVSSPEFLWWSLALVAVLLVGAIVLACAKRWRTGLLASPNSPEHELEHYRTLHEQGDLSREELDRITGLLARPAQPSPGPQTPPESDDSGPQAD